MHAEMTEVPGVVAAELDAIRDNVAGQLNAVTDQISNNVERKLAAMEAFLSHVNETFNRKLYPPASYASCLAVLREDENAESGEGGCS